MKILSITILRMRQGADEVMLETDLPEAVFPYAGTVDVKFNTARGNAEAYCKLHFPDVPIKEVIVVQ